jgi:hypothetical protein
MKINGHMIGYGIMFVIAVILLNMVLTRKPSAPSKDESGAGAGSWTVYGTNGCGWTRKQLEVMKSKNIPHRFVDCDSEDCADMSAYPTLVGPGGEKTVGFKDF